MPITIKHSQKMAVGSQEQVVVARNMAKKAAANLGFSITDQTKLMTAVSELARNMVVYAGGGELVINELSDGRRSGLQIIFEDRGPGIADISLAMTDGYTTGNGLGLGLSGAKRLVQQFEIKSVVGEGTRVMITQWK